MLEQNAAVEAVAPPGFKMHYDFNHNRQLMAVLRLVQELEKSWVVGLIEDPVIWQDLEGWRLLRERTSLPLLMHLPPLGGGPEMMNGCADAYMVGEMGIGKTMARGFACAATNASTVIQLTGGTLTKALAMHLGAVLPNVSHSTNLDDQYEEDVTVERIPVVEGSSPVPERPGLGVEVDEAALQRVAANSPTEIPRHVGILHLPGGHNLYTPSFASVSRETGFRRERFGGSGRRFGTMMGRRNLLGFTSGFIRKDRFWSRGRGAPMSTAATSVQAEDRLVDSRSSWPTPWRTTTLSACPAGIAT